MVTQDLFLFFLLAFARNVQCADIEVNSGEQARIYKNPLEDQNENTSTTDKTGQTTETKQVLLVPPESEQEDAKHLEHITEDKEVDKREITVNETSVGNDEDAVTEAIQRKTSNQNEDGDDKTELESTKSTTAKNVQHQSNSEKTSKDEKNSDQSKKEQNSAETFQSQKSGSKTPAIKKEDSPTRQSNNSPSVVVTEDQRAEAEDPQKDSSLKLKGERRGGETATLNFKENPVVSKSFGDPGQKSKEPNGKPLPPNKSNARNSQLRQSAPQAGNPSCEDEAAEESNPAPQQKNMSNSISKLTKNIQIESLVKESTSEKIASTTNTGSTTVVSKVPSANSTTPTVEKKKWSSFFTKGVKKAIWTTVGVIGVVGIAYYIFTSINY